MTKRPPSIGSVAVFLSGVYRSPWKWRTVLRQLDDAMVRHGTPDIFNTDQGSQFSSAALPVLLHSGYRQEHGGKILA
jgi:hypothetical protein